MSKMKSFQHYLFYLCTTQSHCGLYLNAKDQSLPFCGKLTNIAESGKWKKSVDLYRNMSHSYHCTTVEPCYKYNSV